LPGKLAPVVVPVGSAGWCAPLRVNVRMVSYGNPMHTGLFRQPTVGCAFVRD